MAQVICPGCRTNLDLPPQVPLAGMLCPRCKAPLAGGPPGMPPPPSGGFAPQPMQAAPPMGVMTAAPPQTYPAAPYPAPQPFALDTPAFTRPSGPRRYGLLLACIIGLLLIGGLVLDIILLNRSGGAAKGKGGEGGLVFKGKDPKPPTHHAPETKKLLDALNRGVEYLKERVRIDDVTYYPNDDGGGSALGPRALAGLTLMECGVPASDASVVKVADEVRKNGPSLRYTYSMCLAILFLDRLDRETREVKGASESKDKALLESLALRLIASQNTKGGWDYNCLLLADDQLAVLRTQLAAGSAPIASQPAKYDDNSINQFATLALWAAKRHGIKVEKSLEMVERRFRSAQNEDGSWGYYSGANDLKAATTCAGLIGLAVGRGIIEDKEVLKKLPRLAEDPAVVKALSFVSATVGKRAGKLSREEVEKRRRHAAEMNALNRKWHSSPESRAETEERIRALDNAEWLKGTFLDVDAWGDLYFLWSVERVGVIYSMNRIGAVDWYEWGVPLVLEQQRADGSWHDRFPGVPDTCFALLFLRRANVAQDLTERLQVSPAKKE